MTPKTVAPEATFCLSGMNDLMQEWGMSPDIVGLQLGLVGDVPSILQPAVPLAGLKIGIVRQN